MLRTTRAAVAISLALAFTAVPLIADWCAVACGTSAAGASAPAPACHHVASSIPRLGHHPPPCGQRHQPIVVDAAATAASSLRAPVALVLTAEHVALAPLPFATSSARAAPTFDTSPLPLSLTLSSALRI
jgi:hypothetical protein